MRRAAVLFLFLFLAVSAFVPALPSATAQDAAPAAPAKPAAESPVVSVPTYENATCPIMARPSSKALFTDTEFGRIYVCCPPCIQKINADPARAYATAYPVVKKAGNTVDPVTDAPVGDKPVFVSLQGYEIALASEASVAPAKANAQVTLVKALNPDVVDLRNGTDPVTGQPVVANAFVLVDRSLIRLSTPASVEAVKKDPAKALATAKEIVAKEEAARAKAAEAQPK